MARVFCGAFERRKTPHHPGVHSCASYTTHDCLNDHGGEVCGLMAPIHVGLDVPTPFSRQESHGGDSIQIPESTVQFDSVKTKKINRLRQQSPNKLGKSRSPGATHLPVLRNGSEVTTERKHEGPVTRTRRDQRVLDWPIPIRGAEPLQGRLWRRGGQRSQSPQARQQPGLPQRSGRR